MSTTTVSALAPLFEYLDGLQERPPLTELKAQVSRLRLQCEDLAEFIRFSERGYQRNLVRAGGWYNVLVLCWKNGQRSPIHDHAGSVCALRVLRGVLTETLFEFTPNGHVKATLSRDFDAVGADLRIVPAPGLATLGRSVPQRFCAVGNARVHRSPWRGWD